MLILGAAALFAAARWLVMSSPGNFEPWLPHAWFAHDVRGFTRLALNNVCSWLLLVAAPLACLRRRLQPGVPAAVGLGLGRPARSAGIDLTALVVIGGAIAVGVIAPRLLPSLRAAYPLNWAAGDGAAALLVSELLTVLLLLATEIFYRGLVLQLLHARVGVLAVYLLLPVYVLDHWGAPTAEVVASAAAGAILGHLALAARSIWPGFAAHAGCAVAVDLTSLCLRG